MFRQEEIFVGGWQEKTIDFMQKRRFEQQVAMLPPLGAQCLDALTPPALRRRLESSWQDFKHKPMQTQQMACVWQSVLGTLDRQADCLSRAEHELVERTLILGGAAEIEDAQELNAAYALSLRLWANVGLVSGKPYLELEPRVLHAVAKSLAREEHDQVRKRLDAFEDYLSAMLYRVGAMDDRQPQQFIVRQVLCCGGQEDEEALMLLARRYLWASFDCVDYSGGVMLVHPALADPHRLLRRGRRQGGVLLMPQEGAFARMDILPEEIPLEQALSRAIAGALRDGHREQDVARTIRFLCKQGAPLSAMEEVLRGFLIVAISAGMRDALRRMYFGMQKWMECAQGAALQ